MLRCGQSRADSVADKMFVAVDSGEVEEPVARAARGYLESYCVEVVGCTEEHCRCIAGAIVRSAMGCSHSLMLVEVRYSIFARLDIVVVDSCYISAAGDAVVARTYYGSVLALA